MDLTNSDESDADEFEVNLSEGDHSQNKIDNQNIIRSNDND